MYRLAESAHGKFSLCRKSCRARQLVVRRLGRDETAEKALERRLRESQRVDERVRFVNDLVDWEREKRQVGRNLLVLEIQGETECHSGQMEEAEYFWKLDIQAAEEEAKMKCAEIKHTFQRIARDCADATFLSHTVAEPPSPASSALCDHLGVEILPTLQFWRDGVKLWEHRGALHMEDDLAEGVLYYEGSAADGIHMASYVTELETKAAFNTFVYGAEPNNRVLKVVNVALTSASPCIHVYPAVLALARNFMGHVSFARAMADGSAELEQLMKDYHVLEVPTFLFFRDGKEVGRHVGSSRADLIGQILQIQQTLGIMPPPKPSLGGMPRPQRQRASWR
jgi:hypothetical protein